jgi:hypothetical protein
MNNEGMDKQDEAEGWFIVFPAGDEVAMEIDSDGARGFGPEGQTRIVFTADGNVDLRIQGEKAEHKALRKNSYQEVAAGGVTLTIRDFVYSHTGEPTYGEALAKMVYAIVHETPEEAVAHKTLDQLKSVLAAAHRRVHEGSNSHRQFRVLVIRLSKRLGRPPCRSEIRKAMFPDTPRDKIKDKVREIARLCAANKLSWLLRGEEGRPPEK